MLGTSDINNGGLVFDNFDLLQGGSRWIEDNVDHSEASSLDLDTRLQVALVTHRTDFDVVATNFQRFDSIDTIEVSLSTMHLLAILLHDDVDKGQGLLGLAIGNGTLQRTLSQSRDLGHHQKGKRQQYFFHHSHCI